MNFRIALSTAVLIAVTIKSAYLSRSLVDRCPKKSAEPSASSSVDLNTFSTLTFDFFYIVMIYTLLSRSVLAIGALMKAILSKSQQIKSS